MQKHSKIGASGAKRWMSCPGSVRLCDGITKRTSEYAAEGTAAHALAEKCIRAGLTSADPCIGEAIEGFLVTNEMAEAVNVYLNSHYSDTQQGDDIEIEVKFALNEIHTGLFGTADRVRFRPSTGELKISDYKHGAGVAVEVEENPQLLYYAVGAAWRLGNVRIRKVVLEIVQPRCPHPDGPVRTWETDLITLVEFADDLLQGALATENPEAPLRTGDHCRWCPAAGFCPELARKSLAMAAIDFAPNIPYTPGELGEALESVPMVRQWLKSIEQFALDEALAGRIPPGHKLVEKRATRKWRDDVATVDYLKIIGMKDDDIFEPQYLRTPAQIELKLGKKGKAEIKDLVTSETSGVTLAPLSDRRTAVAKSTATDDFGTVGEESPNNLTEEKE